MSNMKRYYLLFGVSFILLYPNTAIAYIGPGLGAGTIAAVLGFIASIFLALFALLWYPFKRIIRRFKGKKENDK